MSTKTILITGQASGIGLATAKLFLDKGWKVIGIDKDASNLVNENLQSFQVDIQNHEELEKILEKIKTENERIDVLFNNAGYGYFSPAEDADFGEIKKQIDVNFLSQVFVIQNLLPKMRTQGGGVIVSTTSMLGRISLPFFSFYSASKWAFEGYLESLRFELSDVNIKIKIIEPGTINTNFQNSQVVCGDFKTNVYKNKFQSIIKNIFNKMNKGASPEMVAKRVYKAATDNTNKLRYKVDFMSYFLIFNRYSLPVNWYQFIVKIVVK